MNGIGNLFSNVSFALQFVWQLVRYALTFLWALLLSEVVLAARREAARRLGTRSR